MPVMEPFGFWTLLYKPSQTITVLLGRMTVHKIKKNIINIIK